jgi:hypothetical protein
MLHKVKTTSFIIKRTPLLCGVLVAAAIALLPIPAQAQCKNWDASGEWQINQRGLDALFSLRLVQKAE